ALSLSKGEREVFPQLAKPACVNARGFTFLELILVLLIIGVAAALVGPAIGSRLRSGDPRRTAVQLRAAMELLRVGAVRQGEETVLIVAPHDNMYWREPGGETIKVPPEGGVLSARGRLVGEEGQVEFRFYPDGTNSGGEVRIEQRRGVAMTTYVLYLDPLLGTATIWRDE
ncbi:MAG: prepilin-type N-terminal cleavage/methylation domain-containing protein, partial [Deltaproteobacteria bacterium]|nr:prepilin-type N-terminal cleavage/methylation domain-containing protein [Deltaproteobacteria bacterium]